MLARAAAGPEVQPPKVEMSEVGVGIGRVVDEVLEDLFGRHGAGDGSVAGSDALSHRDDVGLDVEVLVAEPLAGTAKAANDFVDDQEQFVLVADLADGFIVASRGNEDAAASGHRFHDHGAEFVRTHGQDDFFKLLGHLHTEVGAIAELGAVDVAVGEFIETGSEGTVLNFTFELAASAQGADGGAVVVTSAVQDAGLLAAVLQLAVTMDYSIFLWHSYNEQLTLQSDHKEAMAVAIHNTFTSVIGSSATTIAGFIALCFMSFTYRHG